MGSIERRMRTIETKDTDMGAITVKEQMTQIIQAQPEDSSFPEILKELAFALMIDRGLQDSRAGRTISNEEMIRRIHRWQK
jgi:predicted transcriptional regulator